MLVSGKFVAEEDVVEALDAGHALSTTRRDQSAIRPTPSAGSSTISGPPTSTAPISARKHLPIRQRLRRHRPSSFTDTTTDCSMKSFESSRGRRGGR